MDRLKENDKPYLERRSERAVQLVENGRAVAWFGPFQFGGCGFIIAFLSDG